MGAGEAKDISYKNIYTLFRHGKNISHKIKI